MWLILAFTSAALLGLYDVAKKQAVKGNAVPTVLLLNTLFSSLLFLPVIISSEGNLGWFDGTIFDIEPQPLRSHLLIILKSAIVLSSWIFGYFGIKHLPIRFKIKYKLSAAIIRFHNIVSLKPHIWAFETAYPILSKLYFKFFSK